jgi:membrane-bound lytic murein transglycosylase D
VAASYNRGMAGMARAIANQQEEDYYNLMLNEETSRYLFRILAIKEIFEDPSKYSFNISLEHMYKPYSIKYLEVNTTIKDLVSFSKENGITYKTLKYYNPWLRKGKLTVRNGKSYQIAVPL